MDNYKKQQKAVNFDTKAMGIIQLLGSLFLVFSFSLYRASSELERARSPPRGWNSYDSFCWTISEEEFLSRAKSVWQYLLPHGYEYVVVDYLWYRQKVPGANTDSLGFDVIDEWGRMVPDPGRWPSSTYGKGFTEVAKKVHDMGLKFGIHVMRGISTQAYNANTPILDTATGGAYIEFGRQWTARDIGVKERACAWMQNGFMSVNTTLGAGRAFLRSLYEQYAEWGVDLVKHDCVFGQDLDLDEITFVSEVLKRLDRPILYSLSPGTSVTPSMAREVSGLVNMYRITGDDWDTWEDVASHFIVSRDFSAASMIGAEGLLGKSWPDLDMLPLGRLTDPGSNEGPHRQCKLNLDEQRTQMTLWAMAKSPLMFGGDVGALDKDTHYLITQPTLLEINSFSSNNKEFPYITGRMGSASKIKRPTQKLGRNPKEVGPSHAHVLGLSSCKDPKVNGWSVEALDQDVDQICWKEKLEGHEPLCLHKRKTLLASDEQILYKQSIQELHLFASDGTEFCLDASSKRKLTSKEFKSTSFSVCRRHANQMWELNASGALINNYSGLCAAVNLDEPNVVASGIRSWIATGRTGEIYVAFFNLNSEKTEMYANIADVVMALPGGSFTGPPCAGREVWSGKDLGSAIDSISIEVKSHGCALFVLDCSS